jgi:hypothetical protein
MQETKKPPVSAGIGKGIGEKCLYLLRLPTYNFQQVAGVSSKVRQSLKANVVNYELFTKRDRTVRHVS